MPRDAPRICCHERASRPSVRACCTRPLCIPCDPCRPRVNVDGRRTSGSRARSIRRYVSRNETKRRNRGRESRSREQSRGGAARKGEARAFAAIRSSKSIWVRSSSGCATPHTRTSLDKSKKLERISISFPSCLASFLPSARRDACLRLSCRKWGTIPGGEKKRKNIKIARVR